MRERSPQEAMDSAVQEWSMMSVREKLEAMDPEGSWEALADFSEALSPKENQVRSLVIERIHEWLDTRKEHDSWLSRRAEQLETEEYVDF